MLCEHCGKTFQREGNLKRHKCKKNIYKSVEKELQIQEDVVEPENNVHSSHSSSDEEEKEPKTKRVTFKDKKTYPKNDKLNVRLSSIDKLNERLSSIDKLNERLSSIDKLNERLSSIDNRISSLEAALNTRASTSSIVDELSKVKTELTHLFDKSLSKLEEKISEKTTHQKTPEKRVEEKTPEKRVEENNYCLIMATNEDRLKRKLFKIFLVENWSEQKDKVKDMYHVLMEKMFEKTEGYKMLADIEREFSKKRITANKKWYKLRDDDIECIIDLFN